MIYLDSAATSLQKPDCVKEAVYASFNTIGNAGRGAHAPTLNASRLIYDTREKLAVLFGVKNPERIGLTMNVTEALNMAVGSFIQAGDHVITTVCEHNSVLRPLYRKEDGGSKLTIIPADDAGKVCIDDIEKSIQSHTKAVVIGHASNVTGNVNDLKKLSALTKKYGLLFIVDGAQTAGALPVDAEAMGIDVFCFTGHKGLMGPQGTGGIYVREGLEMTPMIVGGSGIHSFDREHPGMMPETAEAGTLNGHGLAGLNAALDFILNMGVETIHAKENQLAKMFYRGVRKEPGIRLYGRYEDAVRAPIVTLNIGSMDSGKVSQILWENWGICVRGGAHCAPLMHETFKTVRQGAVRFSFSYFNTEDEVKQAVNAVLTIAKRMERSGDE